MTGRTALTVATAALTGGLVAGQISFEQVVANLSDEDPVVRHQAARLLRDAAYPEGAIPLVPLINDQHDDVQLEAIAAELNIFLAEKVVSSRRVALVVEVRDRIDAEATFAQGAFVLGGEPVPGSVLSALLVASEDANPQVARQALYAFAVLSMSPVGAERRDLLAQAARPLALMLTARAGPTQVDVIRAIGRVYARQPGDPPIVEPLGDAVVAALNREGDARAAAVAALGAMRYERAVRALLDLVTFYGRNARGTDALDALARIGHASGVPRLVEALGDRDAVRRRVAIEGLGRTGDAARLAPIAETLAAERDARVVLAGAFAQALLAKGGIHPIAEAAADPRMAAQAFGYLIELAPTRAADLRPYFASEHPAIKAAVTDALGFARDAASRPAMEALTVDADPSVAAAAARAAARVRTP